MSHTCKSQRFRLRRALATAVLGLLTFWHVLPVAAQTTAPARKEYQPEPAQTTFPKGDYAAARIVLAKLNKDVDYAIDGGFRDGVMQVYGRHSHRVPQGQLVLKGDSVSGSFPLGPVADHKVPAPDFELKITATVGADGTLSGSWSGKSWKMNHKVEGAGTDVQGTVSGFVRTEKALAAMQKGFAGGAAWPTFAGPKGSGLTATPTGAELVEDLAQARLLWRSEDSMPQGPGSLFTMRNWSQSMFGRHGGGGASPVGADGRIFVGYLEPNLTFGYRTDHKYHEMAEAFRADKVAKGEWTIKEVDPETLAKYAERADFVMVCMDAVTGKTLWKTRFPNAGVNRMSHKQGPMNLSPLVHGKQVFVMDNGGRVHAMETATGNVQWTTQVATGGAGTRGWNHAPQIAGGVLVHGNHGDQLFGLNASDGKILWKARATAMLTAISAVWAHGGKEYILSIGGGPKEMSVRMIDPADGKIMWERKGGPMGKWITIHGDIALFFETEGAAGGADGGEDGDDAPNTTSLKCVAIKLATDKPQELWAVPAPFSNGSGSPTVSPKGFVALASRKEARLLDVQTGKELAKVAYDGMGPGNQGVVECVEDRFILVNDLSHGKPIFTMLRGVPDRFEVMGMPGWRGEHLPTSSYHMTPMTRCYIDGRMFIRGKEGIFCYDLRKK